MWDADAWLTAACVLQVPFTQIQMDEDVSEAEQQVQVLYHQFDLYRLLTSCHDMLDCQATNECNPFVAAWSLYFSMQQAGTDSILSFTVTV